MIIIVTTYTLISKLYMSASCAALHELEPHLLAATVEPHLLAATVEPHPSAQWLLQKFFI